jgi:hypothetical protein
MSLNKPECLKRFSLANFVGCGRVLMLIHNAAINAFVNKSLCVECTPVPRSGYEDFNVS